MSAPALSVPTLNPRADPPAPPSCKNCGAPLGGAYCAACGQEARIETPTVGEFLREFVQDQMALEGKLLRTLKLLVMRPGALTTDYIAGRRQCYIRPLRLYLALSLVFFGAMSLFGNPTEWVLLDDPHHLSGDAKVAADAKSAADAKAASGAKTAPDAKTEAAADVADGSGSADKPVYFFYTDEAGKVDKDVHTGYPALDARIKRLMRQTRRQLSTQLSSALTNDAPVAMFFLLPLFAGLLQLFYLFHHLRYGVHLLFALNFHSFVFLDMLLMHVPPLSSIGTLLGLAMPVYLVLALRHVYGGRWWTTALRVCVLLMVYWVLIVFTLLAAAAGTVLLSA